MYELEERYMFGVGRGVKMYELEERYMFGVGRGYKCMSWKRDTCLVWGGGYKCTSLKENEYTASKTSTWLEYPCVCPGEIMCVC